MPTRFNPDNRLCDCGHPRKLHSRGLSGRLICMFQHPVTNEPCQCNDFTITVMTRVSTGHLAGRLTEQVIVNRVGKSFLATTITTGLPGLASTGADTTTQLPGAEDSFGFTVSVTEAFFLVKFEFSARYALVIPPLLQSLPSTSIVPFSGDYPSHF
jgi:hypothetical protein